MPTSGRGTTSAPLNPQQLLEKVTGLITEIPDEHAPPDEPKEPDASPAPTPSEAPPQTSDTEPPADEPDAEPDAEDAQEVTVDGEPITVGELKRRGLREADYTRKTQALAEERKTLRSQVEAEAQASVQQDRAQYQQGLKQIMAALQEIQGEPDWVDLRTKVEPGEFLKQKADWEANKAKLDRLKAHEQEVAQEAQRVQAQEYQKYLRGEQDKLKAAIPEWEKPEVAKAEHAKLVATAQHYGFTEAEVRGIADHRAILLLRDAAKYRELKREPNTPKPKTAPIKTARPGTPDRPRPNEAFEKKYRRLEKSGSHRDAMDIIADMID